MAKRTDFVLLASSLLWGCAWLPLKFLESNGLEGLLLVACSYGLMFLVILPFVLSSINAYLERPFAFLSILIAGGLANLSFNLALIYGDVVRVMVLFYLLPVWGVLGGKLILKEAINPMRWCGLCVAVAGAFIILGGPKIFKTPPSWIDGLALLSGLMFALNNIAFRGIAGFNIAIKLAPLFLGCLMFSLVGLSIWPPNLILVEREAWFYVCVFALFWLLIANLGTQWAVTKMPASRSSILIITELIAAVLSAVLIGGEEITVWMAVGGGLIVTATVLEISSSRALET